MTGLHDTPHALVRQAVDELVATYPPEETDPHVFWGAQFDAGLAWIHFPEGRGGRGLNGSIQQVVDTALYERGAPSNVPLNLIGIKMAGPTIASHGSEEQQNRWLRPLFSCAEIWCQLFSEPGSGSDLAGLATRAVRHGDEWVVNGQKVWTTLAHRAKWGLLLARTNPSVPKHRGLTYFVLDMTASGVEVRPLRQMTGDAEFNEVYLTDVRVPDANKLGDEGQGWMVSMTTLMNERSMAGGVVGTPRGSGPIGEALRIWRERGHVDQTRKHRLVQLWIESEAFRLTSMRALQSGEMGNASPAGSTGKLHWAELNQRIYELCMELIGPDAMLYPRQDMIRPDALSVAGSDVRRAFLRSRANSIEGGTSEVLRNVVAERVLGLPRELRSDKDIPWSDVPRS